METLRGFDAIYLGAIGHPDVKPGILEQGILLRLRFELDQYINLRPVKLYPNVETPLANKKPEDIDFVIVRENVEGLYIGAGGFLKKGTPDEVAIQEMIYTRKGVERCVRFAFELRPQAQPAGRSSPSAARPTCSPSARTCGSAPSRRWRRSTPTSPPTTPTWTPPPCGW